MVLEAMPAGLHAHVAEALRRDIASGVLRPGDRLLELTIARRLGVSQAPVREALRLLEREGLLTYQPRRGVYVAPLSAVDIDEIYSTRCALEGLAVRRALRFMTPGYDDVLEALVAEMAAAASAGDAVALIDTALRFHEAICTFARHGRLLRSWRSMIIQTRHFAHMAGYFQQDLPRDVASHQEVLDAVRTGDPDIAERSVKQHVQASGRHLLEGATRMGLLRTGDERPTQIETDGDWASLLCLEAATAP